MPSTSSVLLLLSACLLVLLHCGTAPAHAQGNAKQDNQRHGSLGGSVQRDRGVGTSVHVQGQADAWVSRDGNSRVGVDGHYGQVVSGPARGTKDYGGFVRFQHKFRK